MPRRSQRASPRRVAATSASRFARTCSGSADSGIAMTSGRAQQPAQRQLRRRHAEIARDRRELALAQQRSLPQRRIGHHRHPPFAHPRQELPFDPALAPGDRAPGWSRSAALRRARTARACPRCRNWRRPSAGSCRPRAAARTRPRSRRAERGRANAAGRDRGDRCRAARGCARRQRSRFFGRRCADTPC